MKTGLTNRRCPRCGGNLYLGSDYYIEGGLIGWIEEETCLQCGYIIYAGNIPHIETAVTAIAAQRALLPV